MVKKSKCRQSSGGPGRLRAQNDQAAAIAHWRGLTDQQREVWRKVAAERPRYDRFGELRVLNGLQLFLTIPHDFRYNVPEQWQDEPPVTVVAWPSAPTITINAGHDVNIDVSAGPFITQVTWSGYFSRFLSATANGRSYHWKKGGLEWGPIGDPLLFTWSLPGENMSFIEGETVRVRLSGWVVGQWPLWHDFGKVTVGA